MQQLFALALEPRCPVRHDAFALCSSYLTAEVRLAGCAELAFTAFRCTGEKKQCQLFSILKATELE